MTAALQAIVFDFDGVIADSEPLHLKAFQQALAEEGIVLERDEYFTRYLGYDDVGMFEALARDRGLAWTDRHVTALVVRKGTKLQAMLAAASGQPTQSEQLGYGEDEFAPWHLNPWF